MTGIRTCANGKHCASAPALGGPARLSRSNPNRECFACRERDLQRQIAPPAPGRTYTLTEAAGVLGVSRYRVEYLIACGQLRATATKRPHGKRARLHIAEGDLRAVEGAGAS
jgi:hypothetical protein